jgi:serine/threonine-protein kinase
MIRVNAELVDTTDGSMQWSQRFDRPYKDLFTLQDDISRAVAQALKAKLLPGENVAERSDRPPSGNLDAYNALLQGRFYASRNTQDDERKAIEFLTRATEIDPAYALAWSGLSTMWTTLGTGYLEGAAAQDAYAKARKAVDRALALSPELADAHGSRGFLLATNFDWRGAEAEYRHELALAPNDSLAKFDLARLLATFGEVEQAIDLTDQALASEPLRASWHIWLAMYLSGVNRLDEAEQATRRAIELQPVAQSFHCMLAIIEIQRGNAQAALAAAQQEAPGPYRDIALALARQIGADRGAADEALKTLISKWTDGGPFQIAQVYALRNDAKSTFEWLDRAWSSRDSATGNLLFDPFILRYKDDPRFAAFCHKIGLLAVGETSASKAT